jgi:hypothetical protein
MKLIPLVLAAGAVAVLASATTAAAVSGPSCALASPTSVKSALGITVGAPSVTKNATVTICEFATAAGLLVRFETSETPSLFAIGRNSFAKHGEPTKTVSGLGTQAYSSTFAGGKSNTIVVLKNTTELLITSSEPLAKLEALAKLILPSL